MDSRDRIEALLNRKKIDRIPKYNFLSPHVRQKIRNIFNIDDDFKINEIFDHDIIVVFIGNPSPWLVNDSDNLRNDGEIFKDNWGITYKTHNKNYGYHPTIIENPINKIETLEKYKFPDIDNDNSFELLKEVVKKYKDEKYIIAGNTSTIFEGSWFLRGMENLLIDIHQGADYIDLLFDKFVDYKIEVAKKAIKAGVDIIWLGDDLGMQDRMMLKPEIFRRYLKPRYYRIIKKIKEYDKNIKVAFHTCGYIEPIIADFIDIEVDILNSIQPVNNISMVKRKYGKDLIFWGGIDIQNILPFGNKSEIVKEVKNKIDILGDDGGYIISGSNEIEYSDKLINNLFVYYWALEKYGKY